MSEEEQLNGLIQLRFQDSDESLNSLRYSDLTEVLDGLAELQRQLHSAGALGEGAAAELRIMPLSKGSVIIQGIYEWAGQNPEGATSISMAIGAAIGSAVTTGVKLARGNHVTDFELLENGKVKLKWVHGPPDEVTPEVWEMLKGERRKTKRALAKIMAPLAGDADQLSVAHGTLDPETGAVVIAETDIKVSQQDYRAVQPSDETSETETVFETEATLLDISFESADRWRVRTPFGTRTATIEDVEFLTAVASGKPLHADDIFNVTIRETATTKNERTTTTWALTKVDRKKRGGDGGTSTPTSPEPSLW